MRVAICDDNQQDIERIRRYTPVSYTHLTGCISITQELLTVWEICRPIPTSMPRMCRKSGVTYDKYVKQNPAEKENKTLERFFDLLDVMDMEWYSGDGRRSFSCSNFEKALLILFSEPT